MQGAVGGSSSTVRLPDAAMHGFKTHQTHAMQGAGAASGSRSGRELADAASRGRPNTGDASDQSTNRRQSQASTRSKRLRTDDGALLASPSVIGSSQGSSKRPRRAITVESDDDDNECVNTTSSGGTRDHDSFSDIDISQLSSLQPSTSGSSAPSSHGHRPGTLTQQATGGLGSHHAYRRPSITYEAIEPRTRLVAQRAGDIHTEAKRVHSHLKNIGNYLRAYDKECVMCRWVMRKEACDCEKTRNDLCFKCYTVHTSDDPLFARCKTLLYMLLVKKACINVREGLGKILADGERCCIFKLVKLLLFFVGPKNRGGERKFLSGTSKSIFEQLERMFSELREVHTLFQYQAWLWTDDVTNIVQRSDYVLMAVYEGLSGLRLE
ncbi:hypothetical protein BC831DRAFT_494734 [Entophlyctis helioformis]|nr:hypothetical protein BC831DRAFT_494734 [Entophlyctis helioformis]